MRLSINIDHVATLRNARGEGVPDPVEAARIAERAGADGIVCHLREDRRHITDADVRRLRRQCRTKLDLEMSVDPGIVEIALQVKPDLVTLVPERRRELTTEGGLDVVRHRRTLRAVVERFHARRIPVSLFVDPRPAQIAAAAELRADMIELHTGVDANATHARRRKELAMLRLMARYGTSLGMTVNAGHGLDYANIRGVRGIREIEEVSIGHAVIVRALSVGLDAAVREMVRLVQL